jgi:hypothetical protein
VVWTQSPLIGRLFFFKCHTFACLLSFIKSCGFVSHFQSFEQIQDSIQVLSSIGSC